VKIEERFSETRKEIQFGGVFISVNQNALQWITRGITVLVFALVLFYRLYQLDTVPIEPFSDHAEKILDVYEITEGKSFVFFERNTGREAIQFYWTLLVLNIFNTGFSFYS